MRILLLANSQPEFPSNMKRVRNGPINARPVHSAQFAPGNEPRNLSVPRLSLFQGTGGSAELTGPQLECDPTQLFLNFPVGGWIWTFPPSRTALASKTTEFVLGSRTTIEKKS